MCKRRRRRKTFSTQLSTNSGARKEEAVLEVKILRSAIKMYCFIMHTLFNNLEDEYSLETGAALTKKGALVLASPLYSTHSAGSQSKPAHDVFSKRNMEKAVRLIENVRAFEAHEHIFFLDPVFYY